MEDNNLREQVPDTVPDDIELFKSNGEIHGRDEHGTFPVEPMRGADEPPDDRCGWVVKYTLERYGKTRYCTALPESKFIDDGSRFCRRHKSAEALMERAHELFEHGYFATNYVNFAKHLDPAKFIFAVEMVGGLFEQSRHDFDIETEVRTIDTSESDLIREDEVAVELPVPTNNIVSFHANELWTAALKEIMSQNMQEVVFTDGMAVKTVTDSADVDGEITDTIEEGTEHHLHLPISRVAKDIKEHLKNGGVDIDEDGSGTITFQKNDYTFDIEPDEEAEDAKDVEKVSEEFSKKIGPDAESIDIEDSPSASSKNASTE